MSMGNHPKVYGTAAVAVAFVAGVLFTLGMKDFYPDLERRYQRRRGQPYNPLDSCPGSTYLTPLKLEDHSPSRHQSLVAPIVPEGIESTIGHTPLFKLKSLSEATGCEIFAKAEFLNGAGGSPKDRVALNMIAVAEEEGLLVPGRGDTIYEGTVGSTGISLATLARAKGYQAYICMPNDQSTEKSDLLHHLGATVERVTPAPITSTEHFVNLARRRAEEHTRNSKDGSVGFFADQFESMANWKAHFSTTAPEIYEQMGGHIDAFVTGAGTGGTISGIAQYLKLETSLSTHIILADPTGSGLYNKIKHNVMFASTEREGTRRRQQVDTIVEGVGINRLTANFASGMELIDDAVRVSDEQAFCMARWLVEKEGVFVGSSSAVNCVAAVVTALRMGGGKRVVTILCDGGARHLSKFWKKVGERGLEEGGHDDLIKLLGVEGERTGERAEEKEEEKEEKKGEI
ncbi:tryptophan synthase beta subunit-like PLP-dependent enzyme [Amylocarpus encephaloides]|uniref:Tryptophan synthase beta subunit-like PLP-dependent enzyme n=1 Tax=Amylocarpus encephaloides TaxID=45428 RepID=A0A9P7YGP2_9HELO|nr:tryptophan synthase beta subunit-like PLP-dependent enzyme [Amylocarpus encephaloides]